MVVPFPPGGSSDILGRITADRFCAHLDASVVVREPPGGTTQIGTGGGRPTQRRGRLHGAAGRRPPASTVLPNLRKFNFSLDSFEAIGGVGRLHMAVMAVRKTPRDPHREGNSSPTRTAGTRKASLRLCRRGLGPATSTAASLSRDTGIEVLHRAFCGSADVNALVAGETDFIIDGAVVTPMVKAAARRRWRPSTRCVIRSVDAHPQGGGHRHHDRQGRRLGADAARHAQGESDEAERHPAHHPADKTVQELIRATSIAAWQTPETFARNPADQKMYGELLPAIGVKQN